MPAIITEIIVSAGRTVNHPYETYSNLKPQVTVKATISPEDDYETEYKKLAARAERLIEDHKENLIGGIRAIYDMREAEREITSLEAQITRSQQQVERLRKQMPQQHPLLISNDE